MKRAWEEQAPPPPRQQHQVQPPMAGRTLRAQSGLSVRGGEKRSTQSLPTPRVSRKSAERAYSKVNWSNSESKQPSPVDEWDHGPIGSSYELFAAALGNLEWLQFCLNRDRGEIPTDNKGFTAIHFAAQSGKLECLQLLVEKYKFPVDQPTNNGQTPLHLVIHRDNKTMVLPCIHYLLKHGAALNTQTCNGSTPLHLAAREGLLSCVKVLVKNGANVHARDAMGCKPIDYCRIWNHLNCARFLKDAMWKRDKKDFACEMKKLKRLKGQLILMEQDYLIEYQKEHQILREADFKKWLRSKVQPQGQSLTCNTELKPRAPPRAITLSKTLKPPRSFHPSPEALLQQKLELTLQPFVRFLPTYQQPTIRRPELWNRSNNPATSPTAQISYPQGIRLGVHPDPSLEYDFHGFIKVKSDGHGGARLHTVAGNQVGPVPRLPLEVIIRELYPLVRPYRMKVPQGFYSVSMRNVARKRYLGDHTFWTDTLAMSLRETFDKAFLATVQAHQGLPTLPSP
ncbi:ankyrin repeat domain-containing protein 53 [Pteropus alecto]|uniref:ankyrin repeat domain-containing protein 53 n=1 Tax=Pteropus alecto TaxID=9402 RepID=UPI000768971A|nr:ankyrin repeat domain-containing protein 53 [Pteropus alecto]